jgi:myo-inositol catabolism protein IolC
VVAFDLKMQLGDIKLEIGNLKNEVKELKDEVKKAKNPIVFDNAVVMFLAIFIAALVAIVWKK